MWDALQDPEEDAHVRAHACAHAHTHKTEEVEKGKRTKFDLKEVEVEKKLEHDRPSFSAYAFVHIPEDDVESWFDCMCAPSCAL